jgi:hypothetical protein
MVFIRLVSAIEVLASDQAVPDDRLKDVDLLELIPSDRLTDEQRLEVHKMLLGRKSRARFRAFLREYSAGFFDTEPREPAHTQVTPDNLDLWTAAIYDARSDYLHKGYPMYLSPRMQRMEGFHSFPGGAAVEQNRRFTAAQKLPYTDFFHRLVRHCILAWLDRRTGVA